MKGCNIESLMYLIIVEKEGIFHRLIEDEFTRLIKQYHDLPLR